MGTRPALFPEPEPDLPQLSQWFSGAHHRLLPGEHATWTRVRVTTVHCQECAHLQHELAGDFGPRRQARYRRNAGGHRLDLCRAHAERWRERDAADTETHHGRLA